MALPNPLFNLKNKIALVTGSSKGLGKAMARILVEAGADIIITSRNEDELTTSLIEIMDGIDSSQRGVYFVADLSNRNDVERLGNEVMHAFGENRGIDILVNNAGTNIPQYTENVTEEVFDQVMQLNLWACFALTRKFSPLMCERRWGRIVHISSIHALASTPGRSVYASTKSALVGMMHAQAIEFGPYNVTSNCILPGPFLTDLPLRVYDEKERERLVARVPMRRWGQPCEISGPVLLLASEAGSYINGSSLLVDGGLLASFA